MGAPNANMVFTPTHQIMGRPFRAGRARKVFRIVPFAKTAALILSQFYAWNVIRDTNSLLMACLVSQEKLYLSQKQVSESTYQKFMLLGNDSGN